MASQNIMDTPLQNLFYYIRDLYSSSQLCYDFEKEPNNDKIQGSNIWQIDTLISIHKHCKKENIQEFSLAINNELKILDYVLNLIMS